YDPLLFRTVIKRYWWYMPIILSFFFFIAMIYLRYTKPIYESNLILQIENEDNAKNIIDIENINTKKDIFYSEVELLRSELLFNQTIKNLGFEVSIFYKGKFLTEEKYKSGSFNIQAYELMDSSLVDVPIYISYVENKINLNYELGDKSYEFKEEIGKHIITPHFDIVIRIEHPDNVRIELLNDEVYFVFNSLQNLSENLYGNLVSSPLDERASTVYIGFRGDNPRFCHDITLALANEFIKNSVKIKKKSSESILNFIDLQLDSLSSELKKSKDSLMNFQRVSNITDPEKEGIEMKTDVSKFQDELFNLEDEIRTLQSIYRKLQDQPNRLDVYRILPELLGKSYETAISSHIESLHALMEEREDILFRVT